MGLDPGNAPDETEQVSAPQSDSEGFASQERDPILGSRDAAKRIQRIRQLAFRPRLSGELANRICDGDNHRARLHDGSCKSSYCAARASFDPGRSIT